MTAGPGKEVDQDPRRGRRGEITNGQGDTDPEIEGDLDRRTGAEGLALGIGGGDQDPEISPTNIRSTKRGLEAGHD